MKVRELIEKLKQCNPESEVYYEKEIWTDIWDEDGYCDTDIHYEKYDVEQLIEDKEYNIVTLYEED